MKLKRLVINTMVFCIDNIVNFTHKVANVDLIDSLTTLVLNETYSHNEKKTHLPWQNVFLRQYKLPNSEIQ